MSPLDSSAPRGREHGCDRAGGKNTPLSGAEPRRGGARRRTPLPRQIRSCRVADARGPVTPDGVADVQRRRPRELGRRSYALPRRRVGCPSVPRPVPNHQSRLGRIEARRPLQVALSASQGGPCPYAHAAERTEAFQLWRNPSSRPVRERTISMTSPGRTAPPDDVPPPLGGRFLKPTFSAFVLKRRYPWRFTRERWLQ